MTFIGLIGCMASAAMGAFHSVWFAPGPRNPLRGIRSEMFVMLVKWLMAGQTCLIRD